MTATSIQWTDHTINPIRARNKATGKVGHFCEKVSPGCGHCYASEWNEHRMGTGLAFLPTNRGQVDLFLDPLKLREVLRRQKPTRYFWCDMTDLLFAEHPDVWLDRCFATMALTPQHTHQVLTKRADRLHAYMATPDRKRLIADQTMWLSNMLAHEAGTYTARIKLDHFSDCFAGAGPFRNVWLGVSAEDQPRADERIPLLLQTPAAVRFVSAEPLLGPIDLTAIRRTRAEGYMRPLDGRFRRLDWVIIGGESGPHARPCYLDWVRSLVAQCRAAGTACFCKQLGSCASDPPNGIAGRDLVVPKEAVPLISRRLQDPKGGDMDEFPEELRVREWPRPEGGAS